MRIKDSPIATTFRSSRSSLESLLGLHDPIILVICMPREEFLQGLVSECQNVQEARAEHPDDNNKGTAASRCLLVPTLHLLAISLHVHLAFAPTLPHLRAYLSTFTTPQDLETGITGKEEKTPVLALVGLLDVHRGTSDLSAQGLSRTFALAVEAAAWACCRLQIVQLTNRHPPSLESMEESEHREEFDPWEEQVPLLNGTIRASGDERVWSGRTVKVGRILAKWCRVVQSGQRMHP